MVRVPHHDRCTIGTMQQEQTQAIVSFIGQTYQMAGKQHGVIAVSGGIDSAVSCTLLCRALGVEHVYPIMLPYGEQSIGDSQTLLDWLEIPRNNRRIVNIEPIVTATAQARNLNVKVTQQSADDMDADAKIRLGNIMARTRMLVTYDVAREVNALVCGTENKSEQFLGYFTRFGDGASDLEPIQHLYKTQVFELGRWLGIPQQLIAKAPSAGLWPDQTDEAELGFSYADADAVLRVLVDDQPELLDHLIAIRKSHNTTLAPTSLDALVSKITQLLASTTDAPSIDPSTITAILHRVRSQWFKHEVPHTITNDQR